jgi:GT2 family glycosyltransferase
MKIAVLITCHNRRDKTIKCLSSFYNSNYSKDYFFEIFLVDDGSTDDTTFAVRDKFPDVTIIHGNGKLFWAGGMKMAFKAAKDKGNYDAYLLLNDDVELNAYFFSNILTTHQYCKDTFHKGGLYSASTIDKVCGVISYGGYTLVAGTDKLEFELLEPCDRPQACHLLNANILYVAKEVVDTIGFFDEKFTHGIADYDFSLRAFKAGFPVYITPGVGGFCEDDHGSNISKAKNLKLRIAYLKSPLGLAYKEYLYYIKRHFPDQYFKVFVKLWLKTLFPNIYSILKDNK